MPCLLAQLQKNYNYTTNNIRIELYGSLTTKDFKKPHSPRWIGGAETQNGWSHTHVWWIKIGRDTSWVRDPSPRPHHPAQSSCARKLSPPTSGCENKWGLRQRKKLWESQKTPLRGPTKDLRHMQTHSLWDSAPGQQVIRHQWHMGRKWSDWPQGECWETASS